MNVRWWVDRASRFVLACCFLLGSFPTQGPLAADHADPSVDINHLLEIDAVAEPSDRSDSSADTVFQSNHPSFDSQVRQNLPDSLQRPEARDEQNLQAQAAETVTPTLTPTPTDPPEPTPTPSPLPSGTPTPTATATSVYTVTPLPTESAVFTPTATPTPTTTATDQPELKITLTTSMEAYMPGDLLSIAWEIAGLTPAEALTDLTFSLQVPAGFHTLDPQSASLEDGLIPVALKETTGTILLFSENAVEGLFIFKASLMKEDALLAESTLELQDASLYSVPETGAELTAMQGTVQVRFPDEAVAEPLEVRIRPPALSAIPYSLSGNPFEIIARRDVDGEREAVKSFAAPITIEMHYDDLEIEGDESTLTLFYYDEEMKTWRPLPSLVDTEGNILTAATDHLTIFDADTQNWETTRLPGLSGFQTSRFTGAAAYSIGLDVPPGPGGLQPSLTLTYNSQVVDGANARTQASWVGMGWSLDTGYIERNMHGTMFYEDDDTFSLHMGNASGMLLLTSGGEDSRGYYKSFVLAEKNFWRFHYYYVQPNDATYWLVWDTNGSTYYFEDRAVYMDSPPGCTERTWRWSLTRMRSAFDQELTIEYQHETETKKVGSCSSSEVTMAVYPQQILYPHDRYRVYFNRSNDRDDYDTAWEDEDSLVFYRRSRLTAVRMEQDSNGDGTFDKRIRRYNFSYVDNPEIAIFPGLEWPAGGTTLTLKKVQEVGSNEGTLPTTQFFYDDGMHLTRAQNGYGGEIEFEYEAWNDTAAPESNRMEHQYNGEEGICQVDGETGGWWPFDPYSWVECQQIEENGEIINGFIRFFRRIHNNHFAESYRPGSVYSLYAEILPGSADPLAMLGVHDGTAPSWGTSVEIEGWTTLEETFDLSADASQAKMLIACEDGVGGYKICKMRRFVGQILPTYYRVTNKVIKDPFTSKSEEFSYAYGGAATNDPVTSEGASSDNPYVEPYSEFRGHAWVEETAPDGRVTMTYFHQDDDRRGQVRLQLVCGAACTESSHEYAYSKTVYLHNTIESGLDNPPEDEEGAAFTDLVVRWTYRTQEKGYRYDGAPNSGVLKVKVEYDYIKDDQGGSQYGNLTQVREFEGGPGVDDWDRYRFSRTVFHPKDTDNVYLVSLPAEFFRYDDPGSELAKSYNLYDDQTNPVLPPTAGILTGRRVFAGSGDYIDTSYTYDAWGNLETTTRYEGYGSWSALASVGPQTTTNEYDGTYHTYLTSTTNALDQTTGWAYDYRLGLPTSQVDPNGAETSVIYDEFGRFSRMYKPGNPTMSELDIVYYDLETPFRITMTQKIDATTSVTTERYYNGLGELIQAQTLNAQLDGGVYDLVVDYESDTDGGGRYTRTTVPYEVTAGSGYVTPTWTDSTTTRFDEVGRGISVVAPNGNEATTSYTIANGRFVTTQTRPEVNTATTYSDAWGRLVESTLELSLSSTYTYDELDRLVSTELGVDLTTIEYDPAGRKTAMDDADMGEWTYDYDGLGNLKVQTDARGCTTALDYDDLNRLLSKSYSGPGACATTPSVSYSYDATSGGNYGIGRRTGIQDGSGSTAWMYDLRGRLLSEEKTIGTYGTFATAWEYNWADQVMAMTYPGGSGGQAGESVSFAYHPQGWLDRVEGDDIYLNAADYDAEGRIVGWELGSGVLQSDFDYYTWATAYQGGRLERSTTTRLADAFTLQDFTYAYDANGNIEGIEDWVAGSPQLQDYSYDLNDRLTHAQVTGGSGGSYNHTYQYDNTNDNLIYKGGVTLTYGDGDHPHAVTSTNDGWAFTYDAIGDQITRTDGSSSVTLAYDGESRLIGASGSVAASFVYDGDGNRVLSTISGVTTVYVGDHYEIEIGSPDTTRVYYAAGGSRLAMRVEGTLYWLLGDHLGSTTRTLSGTGYELAELRYKAFGETRYSAGETPTTFHYTGQREEVDLGLYYYNARWYDPMVGRFVSADTIVPGAGNPQAWNRYSYVLNNPIRYIDPTGHYEFEDDPLDPYFMPAYPGINPARRYISVGVSESEADLIFARWIRNPLPGTDLTPHYFGQYRGSRELEDRWEGLNQWHASMDVGNEFDNPVHPIAPGTVIFTGWTGMGNTIVIEHDVYGIIRYSVYGHFGRERNDESILVSPEDSVSYSTTLGLTGNTVAGVTTTEHLHFEVRYPLNVNLSCKNDVLSGMRYWAFEGENWMSFFFDLGQIWGYDPDNFMVP